MIGARISRVLRMSSQDQVFTLPTSIEDIMSRREFAEGVHDVRFGLPPRFDHYHDDDFWAYERGRLFALLAPPSMQIKVNGRLNRKAVALYQVAAERRYIV
jgi:hypothetical protein